jgi:protein-S-isoprenylcysteine O-methyltransferase Ste14
LPEPSGPTRAQRVAQRIRVPMGFVVAVLFLWLARPTPLSLLLSLLLVATGVALRAYAAGYVRKNAELTVTGPYAYTRNPLYLGSLLIVLGFGIASANWLLPLLLVALFALIYVPTIQGEEQYLRAHFPAFQAYADAVPRLLPRLSAARFGSTGSEPDSAPAGRGRFSPERYRHHREYNALMGACAIYAVLLLELAARHRLR